MGVLRRPGDVGPRHEPTFPDCTSSRFSTERETGVAEVGHPRHAASASQRTMARALPSVVKQLFTLSGTLVPGHGEFHFSV